MSITVQVAGIRQSLEAAEPQQVSDFIALTSPSKVMVDVTPDEISGLSREGTSLLLEQLDGGTLEVLGFFNGSAQSQLYMPDGDGQLLMASMTTAPGSNSLSTVFVAASDEALRFDPDALMASAESADTPDSPEAQDWWEDEEVVEEGGEEAAAPEAFAVDEGVQIEEVFLAEEEAPGEEAEAAEEAATAAGGWLDGVGPDLMGFMAFVTGMGARVASDQSSSSGDEPRSEEDAQSEEDSAEDAEEPAEDDEALVAAADDDLLLQEDEDQLVLEDAESAEEVAMAAAPESSEPQMTSLSDDFGSTDELAVTGPEVMA